VGVLIDVTIEQATVTSDTFKDDFTAAANQFDSNGDLINASEVINLGITDLAYAN
jgi:hypothetical protein